MIFSRTPSSVIAAAFTMAGVALSAADAQPQAGAPVSQAPAQVSSQQPPAAAGAGLQAIQNAPISPAPLPGGAGALVPEGVVNWTVAQPSPDAPAPVSGAPQNRVLPVHADNAPHLLPGSAAYSPNWLVDGVARVEAHEQRRRSAEITRDGRRVDDALYAQLTEQEKRELEADAIGAAKTAASSDPLTQHLQRWLASSSAAAAEALGTAASDTGGAPLASRADGKGAAASAAAELMQPMLESSGPSIVRLPPPPVQTDSAQGAAPFGGQPASMTGVSENAASKSKPVESKYDPSKPLVNDAKYFPQLRRF